MELGRLATHYSLCQPNIDTHVLGITNVHQLFDTLKVMYHGLTETEKLVFDRVVEKYIFTLFTYPINEQIEIIHSVLGISL